VIIGGKVGGVVVCSSLVVSDVSEVEVLRVEGDESL